MSYQKPVLPHNAPVEDYEKGGESKTFNEHIDPHRMNQNIAARIINPLAGISGEQLEADVDRFLETRGLQDKREHFMKGAFLAQNPAAFETQHNLTEEDKDVIRYENAHKWSHPKLLYLTIALCSIGAATQGWDQTGSNGANLSFPQQFGIPEDGPNADRNTWLVGLVNSAPYIGSAFLGCWLSDPINNYLGRRGCIFICAVVLIVTPICSAVTQNWQQLFVVRLILGFGMGAKGSTVPVFAAENSPAQIRGALVMGWQFWTAFGIFLGTAANVILKDTGRIAWRLQLASAFLPAVFLLAIYICPESPRWLMKKGRYADAYKSFRRLRFTELQSARDMYYIYVQLEAEKQIIRGASFISRFTELFTIPRVRRATRAAFVVMIAQQMCGINIIAFYSSSVFVQANYTVDQALYASLGFGAINFLFAIPAFFTIDTFGRRSLLLFTFPQMCWTLLAAGLCFLIRPIDATYRIGLVALFIYIFAAFYSVGEGPVPFTYSAEVFPLAQREMGMAFAVATCLFWAAVLSLTFPRMVLAFTITGAFGFYAGLNAIAFCMIFLWLPETKQRTLEELDQVFSVPSSVFIRYQFTKALPFWFKRWVLFRRNTVLEPLYSDEVSGSAVRKEEQRYAKTAEHA